MSSSRKAIRDAFTARVAALPGVTSALAYEPGPEAIPPLPLVSMLSDLYGQNDAMTGPATENTWGWEVRIYVDLSGQGYEAAQGQLDDLVPAVLSVLREDASLDHTCLWARLEDAGQPIFFAHESNKRFAWKALSLRAEVEET